MAIKKIKIGETISAEDFESQFGNQIGIGDSISAKDFQSRFGIGEEKRSLLGDIRSSIKRRAQQFTLSREREAAGKQTGIETGFQLAGQTAGGVFDIFGNVISSAFRTLTPDIIEKPLIKQGRKLISKIVEGEAISDTIREYQIFKEEHPRAASNIESGLNIAFLTSLAKPTGLATQLEKAPLKETGKIFIKSGEKTIESKRQSFVRDLVQPVQTRKIKELQVGRTIEERGGIFRRSVIAPTSQELAMERAVLKVKGVGPKKTIQGNYNLIVKENIVEANALKRAIKLNDFIYPNKELISKLTAVKSELAKTLVGDAKKQADNLIAEITRRINTSPNKGSSLLQVRKDFDAWVISQKGANIFEIGSRVNAFTIANKEIRQTINKFLDDKITNVAVRESLRSQSAMFNALKNIKVKAGIEADTAFLRAFNRFGSLLGTKSRIVQIIAASVGIGGLGAAATFALPAVIASAGGFFIFRAGKMILNPKLRILFGKVLVQIDKQLSLVASGVEKSALVELKNFLSEKLKED